MSELEQRQQESEELDIVKSYPSQRYDLSDLCPELTPPQKEILKARNQATLKNLLNKDNGVALTCLISCFKLGLSVSGHKKEGKDYEMQLNAFLEVFKTNIRTGKYQSITPNELKLAILRGASGSYGEFQGINAKSLNKFVLSYLSEANSAITKQRIYEGKKEAAEKEKALQQELKEKWVQFEYFDELIRIDLSEKRKGKTVKDYGAAKVRRLIREGKFKITEELKSELMEETLKVYAVEQQQKRERIVSSVSWNKPTEENEKAAKNRIYYQLAYNVYLEEMILEE